MSTVYKGLGKKFLETEMFTTLVWYNLNQSLITLGLDSVLSSPPRTKNPHQDRGVLKKIIKKYLPPPLWGSLNRSENLCSSPCSRHGVVDNRWDFCRFNSGPVPTGFNWLTQWFVSFPYQTDPHISNYLACFWKKPTVNLKGGHLWHFSCPMNP